MNIAIGSKLSQVVNDVTRWLRRVLCKRTLIFKSCYEEIHPIIIFFSALDC